MSIAFVLLAFALSWHTTPEAALCSPRFLPLTSFPAGHSVFAGRVVGSASALPSTHQWRWAPESRPLTHPEPALTPAAGVVVEVSISLAGATAGSLVEVYPFGLRADCSTIPADSSTLATEFPVGTPVLVNGRPPEFVARSSARSRVEALETPSSFLARRPADYDPSVTAPFDYRAQLEAENYLAASSRVVEYEMLKDLYRMMQAPLFEVGVGELGGRPQAVPTLQRLVYAPGYFGCLACYGRLVYSHVSDSEVANAVIAGHQVAQSAYPLLYAQRKLLYRNPYP